MLNNAGTKIGYQPNIPKILLNIYKNLVSRRLKNDTKIE